MPIDNIKRISLLSDAEVSDIYDRPEFNTEEQTLYFTLYDREYDLLLQFSNSRTQAYFVLQLGYFKAKYQFYSFDFEDVADDATFVAKHILHDNSTMLSGKISRNSISEQKNIILSNLHYRSWSPVYEDKTVSHISELLRRFPKGHNACRQFIIYLENQKIIVPSYRSIQDMFTKAYSNEEARIDNIINGIPDSHRQVLDDLIKQENGLTQLNLLRADQKDFQYTAVRNEIEKAEKITELYDFSKVFVPKLKISKNAVCYYAELTEQYAPFRLRALKVSQQYLHIICFVSYRYRQIMDNLIVSFMYHVKSLKDAGKTYAEIAFMEHSSKMVVNFPQLAKFLEWFPKREENITYEQLNKAAFEILPEEQFSVLSEYLNKKPFDKEAAKWEFYLKSSRTFSLYLRPILMAISFDYYKEDSSLIELMSLLKKHYSEGKPPSKLHFSDDLGLTIPQKKVKYLKKNEADAEINPYLFEFYVYLKMYHQIDRGRLFCNHSVSYCDIDHDLVEESLVDDVEKIAEKLGYSKIPIYCGERLDDAMTALDEAWTTTTENILAGNNSGFNIKTDKKGEVSWSLLYDSKEKRDDHFFETLPKSDIANVVAFIGEHVGMWDEFTHIKDRYIKRKVPDPIVLNACVLSEAFGFSTERMNEMSDLDANLLKLTREDFVRIDTICAASDLVSNYICSLKIFELWNLLNNKLLADADGQKFSTSESTIQSRYSKKHLGRGPGISLYTLIANFVAVNAKNIGLNEYEGNFLYDMVYNNKTDVEIELVTGDNHSLNRLNFLALDSIDVNYVP